MELHQIRYFVALSQELNFQRAARRSHITQPTLSQQIQKLEREVGLILFERSPQGVKLTESGKKFLPDAIAVLETLAHGLSKLKEGKEEISGLVRIASIPTIAPYLLPLVVREVQRSAPKLQLEIFEETTSMLVTHLKEGAFDLGVLSLPIQEASLVSRPILKEPFYIAVSKHNPLAGKKSVNRKQIMKEKLLILQEGHCFSDQTLEFCRLTRKDEQVVFQGSSLSSVMRLASAGEGITLVPEMAVEPRFFPDLKFIPFSSPEPKREIGVIWRVTTPLTKAHHYLLDVFENLLKKKLK